MPKSPLISAWNEKGLKGKYGYQNVLAFVVSGHHLAGR
ncbi:hypothetical protein GYMC10_2684 [Paenibacillus sp. Y412MC10]|nr:hypothetical protein GYMC10_2684 [Paenibacillus sp. Y412MC10]